MIAILTDSTCDIPNNLINQYDIRVVPQYILWGSEQFRDRVDMQPIEFYERLIADTQRPTSSQATAGDFSQAIELSEESGDIIGSLVSNYMLGLAYSWECEFEKTSRYIEKALDIFTEINFLWGIAIMKALLSFYAFNYQGQVKQGYQTSSEALKLAQKSDDILSQAMAYSCHGVSCFFKGKQKS